MLNRIDKLDPEYGFYRLYNYNFSLQASTIIYGRYEAKKTLAALDGERFALVLPAVANADVLEGVCAWAWAHRDRLTAVYAANVAHLGMDWGVETVSYTHLDVYKRQSI